MSLPFQVTSGFESASLISEDTPTISVSAAKFSRVYSPSSIPSDSSKQLPEYYLEEYSRPPTPNPHEYHVRVNSKIIRTLHEDPRYTLLPVRTTKNSSPSNQRKQREIRRLQEDKLVLKFEVEVTFTSLKPHPFSLSTRVTHKTTPSPFLVTSISFVTLSYQKLEQVTLTFIIPTRDSIIVQYFNNDKHIFLIYITYTQKVYPTSVPKVDTTNPENHISEQDPNILNLMVSHYDCAK